MWEYVIDLKKLLIKRSDSSLELSELKQYQPLKLEVIDYEKRIKKLKSIYISNIDDSLVRLALRLKCCDGLEWAQIAQRIGGGNTKDSIKKQVYRYLEKH